MNNEEIIYEIIIHKYRGITFPLISREKEFNIEKELYNSGYFSDDSCSSITEKGKKIIDEPFKRIMEELIVLLNNDNRNMIPIDDIAERMFPSFERRVLITIALAYNLPKERKLKFNNDMGVVYKDL